MIEALDNWIGRVDRRYEALVIDVDEGLNDAIAKVGESYEGGMSSIDACVTAVFKHPLLNTWEANVLILLLLAGGVYFFLYKPVNELIRLEELKRLAEEEAQREAQRLIELNKPYLGKFIDYIEGTDFYRWYSESYIGKLIFKFLELSEDDERAVDALAESWMQTDTWIFLSKKRKNIFYDGLDGLISINDGITVLLAVLIFIYILVNLKRILIKIVNLIYFFTITVPIYIFSPFKRLFNYLCWYWKDSAYDIAIKDVKIQLKEIWKK